MPKPPTRPYRFTTQTPTASRATAEKAAKQRNIRLGFYAIAAIGALVFASAWSPPSGKVHSFTKASDYRAERESGCTNSGEGCHGKETAYTDFNAYHPNSKCTACHDYKGVGCLPCHSPKSHECPVCHDGTLKQSPDRVRITDPYPRGHYRETTHTAMGTDYRKVVPAVQGGEAQASCKSCHARDLAGAHLGVPIVAGSTYGDSVGCGECHNDVRAKGLAEVKSDWEDNSCEACHGLDSSSPMHKIDAAGIAKGSSPKKCGETGQGCHATSDLHEVHPNAPKDCSGSASKGEPGCHDLELQAQKPTAKTCGGGAKSCHAAYTNDSLSHKNDDEVHSPEGVVAASNVSFYDTACGDCHWMDPDGISLITEHELGSSAGSSDSCRSCHNHDASLDAITEGWDGSDGPDACDSCHGRSGLGSAHATELTSLHIAEGSDGCAETGDGCHIGTDLMNVGDSGLHESCLRCHDKASQGGNVSYEPGANSCGSSRACHARPGEYEPSTSIHDGSAGRVDGADPAHLASLGSSSIEDSATGLTVACALCHAKYIGTEHARPSNTLARGTGTVCIRCHSRDEVTSSVVLADWPSSANAGACYDCHAAMYSGATHARTETMHVGRELDLTGRQDPGACVEAGCHGTTELRSLHLRSGCTPDGCHQVSGSILGAGIKTCGGPAGGSACHAGYSGLSGHSENAQSHGGIELDLLGSPTTGFCARPGCHTSINLKTLHGTDGCIIDGCHKPGSIIGIKSCGGTDSTVACHIGFTATEHFVDHTANRSGTINGITYGAGHNTGCFGCHNADVTTEHTAVADGAITGGGASNCRVCHDDPADPGNGDYASLPAVTGAVATNDFRCATCHASGSATPAGGFAASPHKRTSTALLLSPGFVWADPAQEWATAFSAPTGGGHNVTAYSGKRFPVTTYSTGGVDYTWTLPANTGVTQWLRSSALGGAAVGTETEIRAVTVTCADCHVLSSAMEGPHGSSVPIAIDPAYSQTEYANPTRGLVSQFSATGTQRVVCMKCHTLEYGSVAGTSSPGGSVVHVQHARHSGPPPTNPMYYGEKCVDCHVRIPHAWRSPRLLVRTVAGAGRPADTFPYVSSTHDGLAGVLLRDIEGANGWNRASCVTGGCHGWNNPSDHPMPSDVPAASYWP